MLALSAVLAALGAWQLERAGESRAVAESFSAAGEAPLLGVLPEDESPDELRFRRLRVRGAYSGERQFLLDNMVHGGRPGYQVLTPFLPRDGDRWLLVNRGWLPADPDRAVLPDVVVGAAEREVTGRIDRLPRPGLRLRSGRVPVPAPPVTVVSYPTAPELGAELGRPVFGYQLLLDPAASDGYLRDWQPPEIGADRHLMYAGQWFLLSFAGGVAAIWLALRGAGRP
jgi:surfeit locus 1 family protein